MWEHDSRAPVRVCGAEDCGGAPGPSTSRGEWELVPKKTNKWGVFPCRQTLGQAAHRKACRLALAEASVHFAVSYHVGKV